MTQNEMILDYMQRYGSISQAEAVNAIGCYRLSGRIYELKRAGHSIVRKLETTKNRYGASVTYARYILQGAKNG